MTKSTGVGRGGRREGAGGKSADGLKSVLVITAGLDQESAEMLLAINDGNVSVALRALLKELRELRLGASPAKLKTLSKSKAPKPLVRKIIPERGPDGTKYNYTARIRLQAEADAEFINRGGVLPQ